LETVFEMAVQKAENREKRGVLVILLKLNRIFGDIEVEVPK